MVLLYVGAGINHFIHKDFYVNIIPWYFPFKPELNYMAGIAEILLGILLIFQVTRRAACWLIIAMLVVFMTVHVQMVIDNFAENGTMFWISVLRLPLQFVLIWWAYKLRDTIFFKHRQFRRVP